MLADDISQAKPQEETSYWGEAFQFCNVDENDVDGRDDWDPHIYGRESPTARRATVLAHLSI